MPQMFFKARFRDSPLSRVLIVDSMMWTWPQMHMGLSNVGGQGPPLLLL